MFRPRDLAHSVRLADGVEYLIRPIRPDDETLLQDLVAKSAAEDLRLRFFAPLKRLSPELAEQLTHVDHEREMALAAERDGEILGVVRLAAEPEDTEAEFAVFVRSDMKGKGLGFLLMKEIIAYAREHGLKAVVGRVLAENRTMLQMASELGFARTRDDEDPGVVRVRIELGPVTAS